jgi:mono/diheme cytochrome c family protein
MVTACLTAGTHGQAVEAAEEAKEEAKEAAAVDFATQILPMLSENCFACHGPDAAHRAADLQLDQEDTAKAYAIVPGAPDDSELLTRLMSEDEDLRMPPPASGKQLTESQVALIRTWIEQGAPWGRHWAFTAPKLPSVPDSPSAVTSNSTWPQNEIDRFVLARMHAAHLSPSAPASRAAWLRRVSFDLIGLPPTPAEVQAFESDTSAEAYERQVDRLLESPHYGERMAIDWLDIARFADTNGYQNDFNRSMWPWRDWVIRAFNQNMPFDQFILEQVAGDLLPDPTTDQLIATGFNRNHRMVTEGGSIDEEWRVENVVDRVETTATAFLGLTMGCARCHDHKYDPISRKDFYQFYAFFNNVDEQGVYTETRGNVPPLIVVPTEQQRQQLADWDRQIQEWEQQAKDESQSKQLEELRAKRAEFEKSAQTTMIMRDRDEYRPTYVLQRGQYDLPDESETLWPEIPELLGKLPDDEPRNRLALARWLVDPSHPLVARVTVNRIWQRMFGKGLVTTPDNFGVQGNAPSHPELLDWLALRFTESGWDVKQMHKLIVLSATYRQTSECSEEQIASDPENRLLTRGPRHRLSAELVRDNALAVSGLLATKIGGPSVMPYQPDGLWDELAGGANGGPYVVADNDDLYRRSLYTFRKRTVSHPTLATFDAPSWEICQAKRSQTNTPLQALALLNDLTYVEAARHLALRMIAEAGPTREDQLRQGFLLATLRTPGSHELETLLAGYDKYLAFFQQHADAAEQFLSQGKSQLAPEQRTPELAALATVAAVILNLDETITK